jgi:hypothetical protein
MGGAPLNGTTSSTQSYVFVEDKGTMRVFLLDGLSLIKTDRPHTGIHSICGRATFGLPLQHTKWHEDCFTLHTRMTELTLLRTSLATHTQATWTSRPR